LTCVTDARPVLLWQNLRGAEAPVGRARMNMTTFLDRWNVPSGVAAATGIAALLLAVLFTTAGGCDGTRSAARKPPRQFYSNDDGATWFAADASNVPPFDHDGKVAYRARVFKCGTGAPFVSHLERYAPEAKKKLEAMYAKNPQGSAPADLLGFGS
jgi:hypothetical protein